MTSAQKAYSQIMKDEEERNRIVMEQLPQVRFIARRIHERLPQHVPIEDLIHAGVLGLMDAMHKYDPAKNVQFRCYAAFRIRGAILDSLRNLDWSPRDLRRKARRLEEVASRLGSALGRAASEQELAKELDMDIEDFHHMLGEIGGLEIGSLQVESSQDGQEQDLSEQIPADPENSPFAECLRGEMKRALAEAIAELPEKEQQVLSLYYFEELTMKEVGEVLGVGESRISQIRSMAIARLRARLRELNDPRVPGAIIANANSAEAVWKRF